MSKVQLKRKIGYFWPAATQGRKIILLYHSIGSTPWAMDKLQFSNQISWLSDHCHLLSFSNLLKSKPTSDIQVAISFDDGYQALYQHAASILLKNNICPIVYLNTGWISKHGAMRKRSDSKLGHYPDESFLTWHEVNELQHSSWEIGSHGVNHYNFAKLAENMTLQEFLQSKQDIESNT